MTDKRVVKKENRRVCTRPYDCPYQDNDYKCSKLGRCNWKGEKPIATIKI